MKKKVLISDVAVPKTATVVKFGFDQITNPTPDLATKIFRAILYAAVIVNILLGIFTDIPAELSGTIASYSIKIVAAVHAISKLFGRELKVPGQQ